MEQQLKKRFLLVAMGAITLVLCALILLIHTINSYGMNRRADYVTSLIAENQGRFPTHIPKALERSQYGLTAESPYSTRYFSVFSSPGRDVLTTNRDNIVSISGEEIQGLVLDVMLGSQETGDAGNFRFRKKTFHNGTLTVFLEMSGSKDSLHRFFTTSLWMLGVTLFVVFLLLWLLSAKAVAPLVDAMEQQKTFIHDASHELKTPLAVISASADVLEMTGGANEWTAKIKNQVKRMNLLIQDMLRLSRYDEAPLDVSTLVDLMPLLQGQQVALRDLAASTGKTLPLSGPKEALVWGVPSCLEDLFGILYDNAIRYAEPGPIETTVQLQKGQVVVAVTNRFHDFPEDQLEDIFRRFYRSDASRSRNTGGSGIGLALARRLATTCGGTLLAQKPDPQHIRFQVKLPHKKAGPPRP
ncbi:hypothetical protein ABB02_01745 [Clostridiaceae bacterium JG1575]|nr:hypothetical protein ABB02_01745 [Clostridiaceae bacterium JG1575]